MKVFIKAKETENGLSIRYREGDNYFVEDVKFNNYFYLEESDVFDDSNVFNFCKKNFLKGEKVVAKNGTFLKCYLRSNLQRNYLRKILENDFEVNVYEGDINAVKHWLIDNQDIKLNSKEMRVKYYDIETDDRGEFKKEIDGTVIAYKPVMSCAFLDHNKKTKFLVNENVDDSTGQSEINLLKDIAKEINNSDLISAWNGMRFDEPYLRQREEHYNLVCFNWHGVNRFDELVKFKRFRGGFKKYSLDNISQVLLKDSKIDFSEVSAGEGKFYNLWKTDKKLLEKYNIKDVVLMDKIEEVTKDYNVHKMCAELCHCPFEDTLFNSMMSDYLILNRYKNKNIIAPSKPNETELERRQRNALISGGYTFCFKPGHWKNISVVDYKSHYPLVMMTFNISPETFVKEIDIDWEEVKTFLTDEEYKIMRQAESIAFKCVNKNGKFLGGTYKRELKKANIDYDLKDLMFKFIKNYKATSVEKYCKENNFIFTPADFNLDSNGWHFHKHRIFTRERGVIPDLQEFVLKERDRIKNEINTKVEEFGLDYKNTDDYYNKFFYQIGIKLVGNATFGFLGFLKSRFYQWEVADSITTCGRYIIKKSILFAEKQGWTVTSGDSVTGDTIVNIDGKDIKIEDFFNSTDSNILDINGKEVKDVITKNLHTIGIKTKKVYPHKYSTKKVDKAYVSKRNVNKIIRHKTNKKLFKITLENEMSIKVTEDHSMIVRRDSKILNPKSKDLKLGDVCYIKTDTGCFKNDTSWNKGMKPSEWMQKEKYKNWVLEKHENSCWNKIGCNKGMSKTEKIAFKILKTKGFVYEPFKIYKYTPDFVHVKNKIIIELNGSGHNRDVNKNKIKHYNKAGYKLIFIEINEKKCKVSNLEKIIEAKIKEVLNDLS